MAERGLPKAETRVRFPSPAPCFYWVFLIFSSPGLPSLQIRYTKIKKPQNFPFEYKTNGMVFHVYSTPQVKVQEDGKEITYDSFLLTYYEGGMRIPKRRSTWEEIDALIEEVVAAHRKNDPERIELSGRDRRVYLAAVQALAPIGGDVDQAVRDYVAAVQQFAPYNLTVPQAAQMLSDALKNLRKTSLSTAIDFYERHGKTMTATRTVPEVVRELIDELTKDRRGKYHIRNMKGRLGRFAKTFPAAARPLAHFWRKRDARFCRHGPAPAWQTVRDSLPPSPVRPKRSGNCATSRR